MGFSRQEYWSGLPFPSPGIFLTQGSNQCLWHLLHWQADSLPLVPLNKLLIHQLLFTRPYASIFPGSGSAFQTKITQLSSPNTKVECENHVLQTFKLKYLDGLYFTLKYWWFTLFMALPRVQEIHVLLGGLDPNFHGACSLVGTWRQGERGG